MEGNNIHPVKAVVLYELHGGRHERRPLTRIRDKIEMVILRIRPSTNGQYHFQIPNEREHVSDHSVFILTWNFVPIFHLQQIQLVAAAVSH